MKTNTSQALFLKLNMFMFLCVILMKVHHIDSATIKEKFSMKSSNNYHEKFTNLSFMSSLKNFSKNNISALCNVSNERITEFLRIMSSVKSGNEDKKVECKSEDCRNWTQQSMIAFCKAEAYRKKSEMPFLTPLHVSFKTKDKSGWSGFVFHLNTSNKSAQSDKTIKFGVEGKVLMRVCVPVDKKKKAYVDIKCPLEKCSDFENLGSCMADVNNSITSKCPSGKCLV
jgi:hypothetical protein